MWDTAKAVVRGNFFQHKMLTIKEEGPQISNLPQNIRRRRAK